MLNSIRKFNRQRLGKMALGLAVFSIMVCPVNVAHGQESESAESAESKPVERVQEKPQNPEQTKPANQDEPAKSKSEKLEKEKPKKFKFEKNGAIEYSKGDDFRLTCDIYVPEGDGPFPTVLAVHGGAWRGGSKLHMLRHAWRLAERGYVVVAINYRHAPEHKFPAQIHDCKNAVRWMRENAEQYKMDPERIAAYGYSAGGHLVALLGTTDAEDGLDGEAIKGLEKRDTRVCAVIAGGPVCEFDWIGDRSGTLVYWLGQRKIDNPELYAQASPTEHVTPDDPPFYIMHGEQDLIVPNSTTAAMVERLKKAKIEVVYDVVPGKGHIMTFSDFKCFDRSIDFLDGVMEKRAEQLVAEQAKKKRTKKDPAKKK